MFDSIVCEKSLPILGRQIRIAQRLGESADDGERRLELVRDVRDEVAANRLESAARREVHDGEHRAAVGQRSRGDQQRTIAERQLARFGRRLPFIAAAHRVAHESLLRQEIHREREPSPSDRAAVARSG